MTILPALGIAVTSFMPANDLHTQDFIAKSAQGEAAFHRIIDLAEEAYSNTGEQVIISRKWSESTVNANMMRYNGILYINMFGGLFRRPEVTPEGFAMVVCHEFGHAYGGYPYLREKLQISAEGQADYYAANECFGYVMTKWSESIESRRMHSVYIEEKCESDLWCKMSLKAGLSLGNLLGTLMRESVSYETPDRSRVRKTALSYPKTAQCRLDTYAAGTLGEPRPACWFKD